MIKKITFILSLGISLSICGEVQYKDIPLDGLITNPKQEISGLEWYGDYLILLPENMGGFTYAIKKQSLMASLDSDSPSPITPSQPTMTSPNYPQTITGFEGFEAIAINGNDVYITLEAKDVKTMKGYLAWGTIDPTSLQISIPESNLLELETPIEVKNMTYESLLIQDDYIILFYEVNGLNLQKQAWQYRVSTKDFSVTKIDMDAVEYRITDVSQLDSNQSFWAINYLWSGDRKRVKPAPDALAITFGIGETHAKNKGVERLIELQLIDGKIKHSGKEPIQIQMDPDASRNWEGIVRLDDKGFLLATDKYPGMILGFVPTK